MSNVVQKKSFTELLEHPQMKKRIEDVLGVRKNQFVSSVLSLYNTNKNLQNCEPSSFFNACLTASSLDLPINNNLGLAYIIPYREKQSDGSYLEVAQFQIGYKGFKQLALRTGQFKTINATEVRKGELISFDYLTGELSFNWEQDIEKRQLLEIVGYVSYFELTNGFKSNLFMDINKVLNHAKKFSKNFAKYGTGLWKDDLQNMALKTVLKLNLSKNAPLSIDLQKAIVSDQAVVIENGFNYVDNKAVNLLEKNTNEEDKRTLSFLESVVDLQNFKDLKNSVPIEVYKRLENQFLEKEQELLINQK